MYGAARWVFRRSPLPEPARSRFRDRLIKSAPILVPAPATGQWSGEAQPSIPTVRAGGRAVGYREPTSDSLPDPLPARLVAFYLPQFHPIPENDAWWGPGFTEWRNVTRALPQFEGHAQPRLPADLGFYDLRLPEALREQVALARAYGISAFCTYFYWFGGRTLLETPLRIWLRDPSIDFPICLCWANESWTRRWDGRDHDVLLAQAHGAQDDLAFIEHVSEYLRDPRYLRIDGKPVLLVYRTGLMPDPRATAVRWRTWCRENGIGELHLACVHSFDQVDPRSIGFDAAVEFPPNLSAAPDIGERQKLVNPAYSGEVLDWRGLASEWARRSPLPYPAHPAVNCGWDNEPRRPGRGRTFLYSSPRRYRDWLEATIVSRLPRRDENDLVFINAWNEWAEGATLEPDLRLGHAWLEATRRALSGAANALAPQPRPGNSLRTATVVHAWYPEVLAEVLHALGDHGITHQLVVSVSRERRAAVEAVLANRYPQAQIIEVENRGRDILPFLEIAGRLLDDGVDIVLKLHTKRSTHREDGDAWRHELLGRLATPGRINGVINAFAKDPTLGIVAPEGHLLPLGDYMGANAERVARLLSRLGLQPTRAEETRFLAGSMGWFRLACLRPILDAHLGRDEFEAEAGQQDDTMAHALERILVVAGRATGYRESTVAACCGTPWTGPAGPYPYAEQSRPRPN